MAFRSGCCAGPDNFDIQSGPPRRKDGRAGLQVSLFLPPGGRAKVWPPLFLGHGDFPSVTGPSASEGVPRIACHTDAVTPRPRRVTKHPCPYRTPSLALGHWIAPRIAAAT